MKSHLLVERDGVAEIQIFCYSQDNLSQEEELRTSPHVWSSLPTSLIRWAAGPVLTKAPVKIDPKLLELLRAESRK